MALPALDLPLMETVAQRQADADLAEYLCKTLAPVIRRLPAAPRAVRAFVSATGPLARQMGYGQGRMHGFYVVASLLLGHDWMFDPACASVVDVLDDAGMDLETRLSLALTGAIKARTRLDAMLPKMHDIALEVFRIPPDELKLIDLWNAFKRIAELRGITALYAVTDRFEIYESDFRNAHRLPPVQRERLTGAQELVHEHMGLRMPTPVDDIHNLKPLGVLLMTHHLLLAPSFGRFFRANPLLTAVHRPLKEAQTPSNRNRALCEFLMRHKELLLETRHGQ